MKLVPNSDPILLTRCDYVGASRRHPNSSSHFAPSARILLATRPGSFRGSLDIDHASDLVGRRTAETGSIKDPYGRRAETSYWEDKGERIVPKVRAP